MKEIAHIKKEQNLPYCFFDLLLRICEWFSPNWRKAAFLGAILGGLLCHMKGLTSMLLNHDGFVHIDGWPMGGLTSGRWFLEAAASISTKYPLPWLTGVLSLMYIAFAAVLVAELLDLQQPETAGACGLCMATFPTVAATFSYIAWADAFTLSLLLSVVAVYSVVRFKRWVGIIVGALCLCFSMGIYQAYLSVTLVLLAVRGILQATKAEWSMEEYLQMLAGQGVMCGSGAGLYWLVLNIRLSQKNLELTSYQGMDQLGDEPLLLAFIETWKDGVLFCIQQLPQIGGKLTWSVLFYVAYATLVCLVFCLLFRPAIRWQWWRVICASVLALLIPVGISIARLISGEVMYHLLMRYSVLMLFILMLSLGSAVWTQDFLPRLLRSFGSVVPGLICAAMVFNWVQISNFGYYKMDQMYEITYAIGLRLGDRVIGTEGYEPGMPLVIQSPGVLYSYLYTGHDAFSEKTELVGMDGAKAYANVHMYFVFLELQGVQVSLGTAEQQQHVFNSQEFAEMPVWPAAGSTAVIDGIMVVKTMPNENK